MKPFVGLSLTIVCIGLLAVVTCQQTSDPWLNGLNSDTDDVSVNCLLEAGHSDCLAQYSDVIMAPDKQDRCPALAIFVTCIKSECRNANTFQTTFDAITAYCNGASAVTGAVVLTLVSAALVIL